MIGNIILWFKREWKRTFCVHNYVQDFRALDQGFDFQNCTKCGYVASNKADLKKCNWSKGD